MATFRAPCAPAMVVMSLPSLRSSVDAPDQTRVRRIILRMNWGRRSKCYKITTALIWLVSPVLEINVHFDYVVVLVLWRFFEGELFPDDDLLGGRVFKSYSRIRFWRCDKLSERWRGWLLYECTDRCTLI